MSSKKVMIYPDLIFFLKGIACVYTLQLDSVEGRISSNKQIRGLREILNLNAVNSFITVHVIRAVRMMINSMIDLFAVVFKGSG